MTSPYRLPCITLLHEKLHDTSLSFNISSVISNYTSLQWLKWNRKCWVLVAVVRYFIRVENNISCRLRKQCTLCVVIPKRRRKHSELRLIQRLQIEIETLIVILCCCCCCCWCRARLLLHICIFLSIRKTSTVNYDNLMINYHFFQSPARPVFASPTPTDPFRHFAFTSRIENAPPSPPPHHFPLNNFQNGGNHMKKKNCIKYD